MYMGSGRKARSTTSTVSAVTTALPIYVRRQSPKTARTRRASGAIRKDDKRFYLRQFDTAEEASAAYLKAKDALYRKNGSE